MNTNDPMSGQTVEELSRTMRATLTPTVGASEAAWMVRMIWEHLKGWSLTDIAVNSSKEVSAFVESQFTKIVTRVVAGEPLQYVLGTARFYGMNLDVTPAVLIPRPETEELVDIIVKRNEGRSDLRVLDMATGSGCIAIALARNLPFARVVATDLSAAALEVAKGNSHRLKTKVEFTLDDILKSKFDNGDCENFDIIVSNPPYICRREAATMDNNVVDHEPEMALFVPDDNPLLFYRAIATTAVKILTPTGQLYFEINPLYDNELKQFLESQQAWSEIEIIRDTQGKNRFIAAKRDSNFNS